jgi:hypothetical protein
LSEAARRAFETMRTFKYEYQSDFARKYVAEGRAEGITQGRIELVLRQLSLRFGPFGEDVKAHITTASLAELDEIGERLLTARTLQEALG